MPDETTIELKIHCPCCAAKLATMLLVDHRLSHIHLELEGDPEGWARPQHPRLRAVGQTESEGR